MQALDTHDVFNQFDELTDFHLLQSDPALQEVLQRQQAQGFVPALSAGAFWMRWSFTPAGMS